jgi:predicted nucleotide-binding protein (sugar kinase/HSP70/actin superfamily)
LSRKKEYKGQIVQFDENRSHSAQEGSHFSLKKNCENYKKKIDFLENYLKKKKINVFLIILFFTSEHKFPKTSS